MSGLAFLADFQTLPIETTIHMVEPGNPTHSKRLDCHRGTFPTAPVIIDIAHLLPAATRDNERTAYCAHRAGVRYTLILQAYDEGRLKADDFCPALPPVPEAPKTERQHQYTGQYYGSYPYYNRNR